MSHTCASPVKNGTSVTPKQFMSLVKPQWPYFFVAKSRFHYFDDPLFMTLKEPLGSLIKVCQL